MNDDSELNISDEYRKCLICGIELSNEEQSNILITGCNHEFHVDCWNKLFTNEEKILASKSSRIHLWLALPCPICDKRNFIDGNCISNTEYIELLISEVSKQTKNYSKCVEEIEILENKYNENNNNFKKFKDNYNKMTEYIALKSINENSKI